MREGLDHRRPPSGSSSAIILMFWVKSILGFSYQELTS